MSDNHSPIDASENIGVNSSTEPSIEELIGRRLGRRATLRGFAAAGATAALAAPAAHAAGPSTLTFPEIAMGLDDTHHVPEGYQAQVLIRWGDPLGLSSAHTGFRRRQAHRISPTDENLRLIALPARDGCHPSPWPFLGR